MKNLLFILILFVSCTPYRYLAKHQDELCSKCITEHTIDTVTFTETKLDTLWTIDSLIDSIYTELYLECDSNNQVLLKSVNKISGTKDIISSYSIQNNVLKILNKTYIDSIKVLNLTIHKMKNTVQIIEKPVVQENKANKIIWIISLAIVFLIVLMIFIKKL